MSPIWGSRNEEAFREISSQRENKADAYRIMCKRKNEEEEDRGKETEGEEKQKTR